MDPETHGYEVDVIIDRGVRRVPLEIKAGETVSADAFKDLEFYARLSGSPEGAILVHTGESSSRHGNHLVRPW